MYSHHNQTIEKYKDGSASEREIQEFYSLFHHAEAEFYLRTGLSKNWKRWFPIKRYRTIKKVFERILRKIEKRNLPERPAPFIKIRYLDMLLFWLSD